MNTSLEKDDGPSLRYGTPDLGRRDLVHAWVATAVAFAVVLLAAIWGPEPGVSVVWLAAHGHRRFR
jgi:hypothetical protein